MITANDSYFYKNTEIFIPIGHNEHLDRFDCPVADVDKYFLRMVNAKENVLRIIIDHPTYLEPTINNFTKFESIFTPICLAAKKYDIYLLPVIYFANPLTWNLHSYNIKNNGPLVNYQELYTSNAFPLIENRFKWLMTTYDSCNIFAWELANELQTNENPWVKSCCDLAKQFTTKMLSVSIANINTGNSSYCQWNGDCLDYISFHPYGNHFNNLCLQYDYILGNSPSSILNNRISNVSLILSKVKSYLSTPKPILDTETPATPLNIITKFFTNYKLTFTKNAILEENFYNVNLAYIKNGAAGGGLSWACGQWVDGYPNALSPQMELYQKQLAGDIDYVIRNI